MALTTQVESALIEPEFISVVYDGGLAATGQLQFYEFGRASYAFARMIATIEHFRRTGKVAKRISSNSYVNLIIKAPEKGSFPLDILIPIFSEIVKEAPKYAHVPIGILFKYITHSMTGYLSSKQEKDTVEIAKTFLKYENEKTEQSKQETARIESIERMVTSGNVTTQAALRVLGKMIDQPNTQLALKGHNTRSMDEIRTRLLEHDSRESEFAPYREQLESIGQDKLAKLSRKVRPQISEVGLPLRNSAEVIKFSTGKKRNTFATFDYNSISDLNSKTLDSKSTTVEVRISAYDRDTGTGKCDIFSEDLQRASFLVPIQVRIAIKRKIIVAMDLDVVIAEVRYFRNKDDKITSLQMENIDLDDSYLSAVEDDEDEKD